jgi:hypothetical protein
VRGLGRPGKPSWGFFLAASPCSAGSGCVAFPPPPPHPRTPDQFSSGASLRSRSATSSPQSARSLWGCRRSTPVACKRRRWVCGLGDVLGCACMPFARLGWCTGQHGWATPLPLSTDLFAADAPCAHVGDWAGHQRYPRVRGPEEPVVRSAGRRAVHVVPVCAPVRLVISALFLSMTPWHSRVCVEGAESAPPSPSSLAPCTPCRPVVVVALVWLCGCGCGLCTVGCSLTVSPWGPRTPIDIVGRYFGDLATAWYVIVICGILVAVVFSFVWMILLKLFTGLLVGGLDLHLPGLLPPAFGGSTLCVGPSPSFRVCPTCTLVRRPSGVALC